MQILWGWLHFCILCVYVGVVTFLYLVCICEGGYIFVFCVFMWGWLHFCILCVYVGVVTFLYFVCICGGWLCGHARLYEYYNNHIYI
jgi:hypothetical protein